VHRPSYNCSFTHLAVGGEVKSVGQLQRAVSLLVGLCVASRAAVRFSNRGPTTERYATGLGGNYTCGLVGNASSGYADGYIRMLCAKFHCIWLVALL